MAGEQAKAAGEATAEAIETVAENAGATVEAIAAATETAVEQAEARAEAAEAATVAIADSARNAAIIQKVDEVLEEIDEWESEVEARLAALERENQSLTALIASLQAEITAMNKTPAQAATEAAMEAVSSTPPASPEPEAVTVTETTVTTVQPEAVMSEPSESTPVAIPARRRRFI